MFALLHACMLSWLSITPDSSPTLQPAVRLSGFGEMEINENSGTTPQPGFVMAGQLPSRETASAPPVARSRKTARDDFTGAQTPVQLRLPADLVTSLRLLSFDTGKSMSDLAFEYLTSELSVPKAWVSTRKSA